MKIAHGSSKPIKRNCGDVNNHETVSVATFQFNAVFCTCQAMWKCQIGDFIMKLFVAAVFCVLLVGDADGKFANKLYSYNTCYDCADYF